MLKRKSTMPLSHVVPSAAILFVSLTLGACSVSKDRDSPLVRKTIQNPVDKERTRIASLLASRAVKQREFTDSIDFTETGDPSNIIFVTDIENAKPTNTQSYPLIDRYREEVAFESKPQEGQNSSSQSRDKVSPELRELINEISGDTRIDVVLTFKSELGIPRFPEPDPKSTREDRGNRAALGRAASIVDQIKFQRAEIYLERAKLLGEIDVQTLETFWLIDAMLVNLPLGVVSVLEEWGEVLSIELDDTGIKPPQDTDTTNDVDDARRLIRSDPYFNLGLARGYIGLLDTGVNDSHEVFSSADNIDFRRDCVNGGSDCNTGTLTTTDVWPHGTSSAAIVVGGSGGGAS